MMRTWISFRLPIAFLILWGGLLGLAPAFCATKHLSQTTAPSIRSAQTLSGISLYRKSLVASEFCSYSGKQYITTWSDDGHSTTVVSRLYHMSPSRFLVRFIAPKERVGHLIIEDKADQWTYLPAGRMLIFSKRPATRPELVNCNLLLKNYSITLSSSPDIVADRKAYVLTFTSKLRKDRALRFWIDPYTGITLRSERYHAGGNLAAVSYFSDIDYHPKFSPNFFSPKQFKGAKMKTSPFTSGATVYLSQSQLRRSLGGIGVFPSQIREYKLQGVTRMAGVKRETLQLHYSDGLSNVSLFESVEPRNTTKMTGARSFRLKSGRYGRTASKYNYTVLNWEAHHLSLTILGDLSVETLSDLAQNFTQSR